MSVKNPPIIVRRSPIHGTGVYAARRIRNKEEIIYYEGKLITHKECDEDEDNGHTFLFTLNDDWVIEAAIDGNDARWINHSCDPNCEALLIEHDKDRRKDRIVIQAMRTIQPGEELTYDYGIVTDEPFTRELKDLWKCRCGAGNCRGIIIQPEKKKRKKRRKAARAPSRGGTRRRKRRTKGTRA